MQSASLLSPIFIDAHPPGPGCIHPKLSRAGPAAVSKSSSAEGAIPEIFWPPRPQCIGPDVVECDRCRAIVPTLVSRREILQVQYLGYLP